MTRLLAIIIFLTLIISPVNLLARNEDAPGQQKKSPSPVVSVSNDNNQNLSQGTKNWHAQYEEYKNAGQEKKQENLQALGSILVNNRLALLNNLRQILQNMTNISEETRTSLLKEIDQAIQAMNTVQSNIANQGDIQKLRNEIQSMFRNQVYAVVAPKELGEALTAKGMYILGRLQAIQRQLEQTLNQNKNAGKDTANLETLMTQIQNQLKIAQDQLAIADAKFKSMNPANTEEAKAARDEGKAAFRKAKDALKEAHRLLVQMREQLRLMAGVTSPSPSASISPLVSPSATASPSPTIISSP